MNANRFFWDSLAGNLVRQLISLYGTEWRERGYGLRFPVNESPRRTGLHSSLSEKSSFYLPAFENSRLCCTTSGQGRKWIMQQAERRIVKAGQEMVRQQADNWTVKTEQEIGQAAG